MCVDPEGRTAYVSNFNDNTVSLIDTGTRSVVAILAVGKGHCHVN